MNLTSMNLITRRVGVSGLIEVTLKVEGYGHYFGLLTQEEAGQLATAFRDFADLLSDSGSSDIHREKGLYMEDDKGAWFIDLENPIEGGGDE